jgi:hypothetical protein
MTIFMPNEEATSPGHPTRPTRPGAGPHMSSTG